MFFLGCDNEDDNSSSSIIGTWKDNIEGNWIITYTPENGNEVRLENPNYSLVDGDSNELFGDCYNFYCCVDNYNGNILPIVISSTYTNDNGYYSVLYQTWDSITNSLNFCSGGVFLPYFLDNGTEYHEMITFFENGTYSYQVSPTIWQYDESCFLSLNDANIGDTFPQIPMQPYNVCSTGSWSLEGNTLMIKDFSFNVQLDGDNLTLDRSQIGSEEYISTWERQ